MTRYLYNLLSMCDVKIDKLHRVNLCVVTIDATLYHVDASVMNPQCIMDAVREIASPATTDFI